MVFIVCDDVDEIDFVSYDPKIIFHKPLLIITVKRADLYVDIATTKIQYQKFRETGQILFNINPIILWQKIEVINIEISAD